MYMNVGAIVSVCKGRAFRSAGAEVIGAAELLEVEFWDPNLLLCQSSMCS